MSEDVPDKYFRSAIDLSPPVHRNMTVLDRDAFQKTLTVIAAKVNPKDTATFVKSQELQPILMNKPSVKPIVRAADDDRLVLFRISEKADLYPQVQQFIWGHNAKIVKHELHLDYKYWTADEILNAVLPVDLADDAPSAFAVAGHLAHFNLRPEYLPYKHLIGQVILDKNPTLKTVVNKVDNIANQFRVFDMELLAGEPNYVVEHHESNCRFTFNFSEVYWNSRLHHEHERLVQMFEPTDVIADVFAGVGPFAIPAAKKGCAVLANDLNPNSYRYLLQNIKDNQVRGLVRPSCADGREFIREVFCTVADDPLPPVPPPKLGRKALRHQRFQKTQGTWERPEVARPASEVMRRRRITHFVMNLPELAIDFLDAFRGVLRSHRGDRVLSGLYYQLPMVHCYCFTREQETERAEADIRQRVEEKLGHRLEGGAVSYVKVRAVAPHKIMYCVSFRLPYAVGYGE